MVSTLPTVRCDVTDLPPIDMSHDIHDPCLIVNEEVEMSIDNGLRGRVALVTGGSRGIGAAIVRRLAADGADVAFTYRTGKAEAEVIASELRDMGRRALPIEVDLARPESPASVVSTTVGGLGHLDILVNNAGVTSWGPLTRVQLDEFDRLIAIDARAPFLMMQAVADTLTEGGRVVNISSAVTSTALAGLSLYSAVKAFVDQMTKVSAIEFAPKRITVNAVAPGTTATGRLAEPTPEQRTQMGASFTLGRIG
ncbi:MAG: SDR family NAD(P)-dependent oxidoreductase, partial [Acidimicrobiales bacterium]